MSTTIGNLSRAAIARIVGLTILGASAGAAAAIEPMGNPVPPSSGIEPMGDPLPPLAR